MKVNISSAKRAKRRNRIRARVSGTATRPRCAVFRSNKHLYAQLVNDETGKTIFSVSNLKLTKAALSKKPLERAFDLGVSLAETAKKKGIGAIVFDRGGYKYHGKIKALAEGARKQGLEF